MTTPKENSARDEAGCALVDEPTARAFVEAMPVPREVEAHLRSGCPSCHRRIDRAFDRVLLAVERGADARSVADWIARLGWRYENRHCCPSDLVEDLANGDDSARRHVRHCRLCARELDEMTEIARDVARRFAARKKI